jgi:hypothetical protein
VSELSNEAVSACSSAPVADIIDGDPVLFAVQPYDGPEVTTPDGIVVAQLCLDYFQGVFQVLAFARDNDDVQVRVRYDEAGQISVVDDERSLEQCLAQRTAQLADPVV